MKKANNAKNEKENYMSKSIKRAQFMIKTNMCQLYKYDVKAMESTFYCNLKRNGICPQSKDKYRFRLYI